MPKVVKVPEGSQIISLSSGFRTWKVKNDIVQGLSPDDPIFLELQRAYKLIVETIKEETAVPKPGDAKPVKG